MNKTVLVTGASGMIGSNLVSQLLDSDYEVIGLDIKSNDISHPLYHFYSVDLGNKNLIEDIYQTHKIDSVIHLAALAHPLRKSDHDFLKMKHINVDCAINIFEVSKNHNVPVLFISTVDVFGMTKGLLTPESIPNPISNYGKTKWMAECQLKEIGGEYDIYRFSPVYTDEIKRDIQKRYYLKFPSIAYRIGKGQKFEVLNITTAVQAMANWLNTNPTKKVSVIKDDSLLDVNNLIRLEKAEGRAKIVLTIPRWMVEFGYYTLKPILGNSNKSYLIFKALWPFRTKND